MGTYQDMIRARVEEVAGLIELARQAEFKAQGYGDHLVYGEREKVTVTARKKYFAIDIALGGAFLVEKATGEIFNIQGYGKPDKNKKKKADLGNITDDREDIGGFLYVRRYNYLR